MGAGADGERSEEPPQNSQTSSQSGHGIFAPPELVTPRKHGLGRRLPSRMLQQNRVFATCATQHSTPTHGQGLANEKRTVAAVELAMRHMQNMLNFLNSTKFCQHIIIFFKGRPDNRIVCICQDKSVINQMSLAGAPAPAQQQRTAHNLTRYLSGTDGNAWRWRLVFPDAQEN